MSGLFQVMIRFSLETESLFTSVEGINEYVTDTPNEENDQSKKENPPDQWPKTGSIE